MSFCGKCGFKLDDGYAFCPKCGASSEVPGKATSRKGQPSGSQSFKAERENPPESRDSVESGSEAREREVKRCPACGEIVGEHDYLCAACGYELQCASEGSIKDLYKRLEAIESTRPKNGLMDQDGYTATDKKLASAIRNFPIPNTKEDLIEFLVMANSNSNWDDVNAKSRPVPSAWRSKFDQAFSKFEISYRDSSEFQRFKDMKAETHVKAARAQVGSWVGIILPFALLLLMMQLLLSAL